MNFTSEDYSNTDFRNEEKLYTKFYYDEVSTAPCVTWCTEYFYRRMPEGKYRLVEIDSWDNELYCHNEYESAEKFADDIIRAGCAEEELDDSLFNLVLSFCPEDIRKNKDYVRRHFNDKTASLLKKALDDGDRELVKALLPDFAKFREHLYPSPYIPGISRKELNRRKDMLRDYFRKRHYPEIEPDHFCQRASCSYHARIKEYSIEVLVCGHGGGHRDVYMLEDTEKLQRHFHELDFSRPQEEES